MECQAKKKMKKPVWVEASRATYMDKFTAIVSMTKVAGLLYEYGCHEGNYGMENILRGARVEERMAAEGEL